MRKQYHFRRGEAGLMAWDVHRLIELCRGLPKEDVPLSAIRELDEPYWFGMGQAGPTCRELVEHMRLVEAADLAYPVILSPDGQVMDGMHRIARALLLGHSHVRAFRLKAMPEPDHVGIDPDELPYDR
ncbi:hypothetical protein [Pseudofulvimonas gallinarii]|jgi:hypothetical protein|uniref:ParB-like nuclease family protein n=1 Tax=Pseudofulvimonas gallinarii TaxID=634155 RepID=A0A4R3L969_9GAMM|nr:hypothetical protein [Pseudofulvimonas gallinarii]TCS96152.1 hypothetical protein EDC25_1166 [Pseudofulvimonas gallinarii]THD14589.1 hypothetical protein B1808_02700 [Pseudofulvimonas gallinarii]